MIYEELSASNMDIAMDAGIAFASVAYYGQLTVNPEKLRGTLEANLNSPGFYSLLAIENGVVAGFLRCSIGSFPFADELVMFEDFLFVREEFRGQGLAGNLISMAVEKAKRDEVKAMLFSTSSGISAASETLFTDRGFMKLGSTWGKLL